MKTTPKPLGISRLARVRRTSVLFVALALLTATLVGCTRDRPVEGNVATPGAAGALGALAGQSSAATATPVPMQGEPSIVISDTAAVGEGTPSPSAAVGPNGETELDYVVESGDTLLSIAIQFGMTVEDLKEKNLLTSDSLSVGQPLKVVAVPTPTPQPFTYVVQSGDTLGGIAARFGVGQIDIINANRLVDPNAVPVGMELMIPGYAPTATSGDSAGASGPIDPSAALVHVVQSGESLSQIAQDYGVTAASIVSANGIANPNTVRAGTELTIPGISAAEWADRNAVRHTVAPGESLSEIAQQYGVTTVQIVAENGLSNPNAISVGQVLRIPQQ